MKDQEIQTRDVWAMIEELATRSTTRREEFDYSATVDQIEYGYRRAIDDMIEWLREIESLDKI